MVYSGCSRVRISYLEDVLASHPSLLEPVIANSSEDCIVDHIDKISSDVWPYLAKYNRFKPTFANINRYLEEIGKIDNNLSTVLESTDKIIESASFSEEEKQSVAVKVLVARDTLQSAQLRVSLVKSLNLEDYLDVGNLPAEEGEIFALLLKDKHIEDSIESYAHIASTNWTTRELFIQQSAKFSGYITAEFLNSSMAQFLLSNGVKKETKLAILSRISEFEEHGFSKESLNQIANFSVSNGVTIPFSLVLEMASNGVQPKLVVSLLETHLNTISKDDLLSVLKLLKGPYAWLTSLGHGIEKLFDTSENRALLNKLKRLGIVSSFPHDGGFLKISKKRK